MKPNIVKFESLVSSEVSGWHKDAEERKKQRGWRDKAFHIALILLDYKEAQNLSQVQLAEKIGVSKQYINRVLQGKENLTLESISKIENALGISIMNFTVFSFGIQEFGNDAYLEKRAFVEKEVSATKFEKPYEVITLTTSYDGRECV